MSEAERIAEISTEEIVKALRAIQNSAQVVLDSGFGTHEGESDRVYRKRRDLAKNAADRLEQYEAALRAQEQNGEIAACIKSIAVGEDTRLLPCPLCGEPLIKRTTTFRDGNPDFHTAYCHCGFCISEDGDLDEFIARCNRRAQEQNEPLMMRGYNIEHLELVAELMRKHNITPDDLKKCVDNFENALKLVMEVQAAKAIEVLSAHAPVPDGGKE